MISTISTISTDGRKITQYSICHYIVLAEKYKVCIAKALEPEQQSPLHGSGETGGWTGKGKQHHWHSTLLCCNSLPCKEYNTYKTLALLHVLNYLNILCKVIFFPSSLKKSSPRRDPSNKAGEIVVKLVNCHRRH